MAVPSLHWSDVRLWDWNDRATVWGPTPAGHQRDLKSEEKTVKSHGAHTLARASKGLARVRKNHAASPCRLHRLGRQAPQEGVVMTVLQTMPWLIIGWATVLTILATWLSHELRSTGQPGGVKPPRRRW